MFWMRNKENSFPIHTLIWRPESPYQPASILQKVADQDLLFISTTGYNQVRLNEEYRAIMQFKCSCTSQVPMHC